jgi:VWFA-related protein
LVKVARPVVRFLPLLSVTLFAIGAAPSFQFSAASSNAIQAQSPQNPPGSTLKIDAKLVPVRVVVRDSHGSAIGGLTKEDFQVLDNGKAQAISQFFAEHHANPNSQPANPTQAPPNPAEERIYTAYLIDDLHLSQSDLILVREAASRHFAELGADERAAIFTTSGQHGIDFTQDRDKLKQTAANIKPLGSGGPDCPKLNYAQADSITSQDGSALDAAAAAALDCEFQGNPKAANSARQFAQSIATEINEIGRALAERSLLVLKELVGGMSKAPGRSTIVVLSDGIFIKRYDAESEIADLAIRGNVTLNLLDPTGLVAYLPDVPVDSRDGGDTVLGQLSYASGGTIFRNNNDINEGFRRLGGAPEFSYILAFAPDPAHLDGKFHSLKVKLSSRRSLEVQARNGYFAAKPK